MKFVGLWTVHRCTVHGRLKKKKEKKRGKTQKLNAANAMPYPNLASMLLACLKIDVSCFSFLPLFRMKKILYHAVESVIIIKVWKREEISTCIAMPISFFNNPSKWHSNASKPWVEMIADKLQSWLNLLKGASNSNCETQKFPWTKKWCDVWPHAMSEY